MIKYDIAYSLNSEAVIYAATYEEAEQTLKNLLIKEGINLDNYTFEVFDVTEEEDLSHENDGEGYQP